MNIRQVMWDIERCICHVPDACRDCSHYTGLVGFGCMESLMQDAYDLLKEDDIFIKRMLKVNDDLNEIVLRIDRIRKKV